MSNVREDGTRGQTIWVGAVAYDPKVVTIWEGMRRYFHEEAHLPIEIVLFQSYDAQVAALLASTGDSLPRIDIAELTDVRNRTLALGSRDSGHAAILPVHFLEQQGLIEGRDYRTLRFDSDVGKHGDTGTSEVEVVRAVLNGRADAGAIGSPFWKAVRTERLVPEGALTEIWTSPPYNHCMFTARPDLDLAQKRQFAEALSAMSYDNPVHRAVLDAEGLERWVLPHLDGYDALREASARQGFFKRPFAKSAAG